MKNITERRIIGKIQKTFFSGEVIFGGQNPKNAKKISKNFIVPNRSLGHTNHLYTYKGHIEQVGFTLKHQKTTEIVILSQYFDIFI